MPEIGSTLREARMRARIDVSEIEAQTKIRAKYLRALENEEWDLLPGPTFVKSFLRTYGQALGLDGRALVEEYKLHYEHPGDPEPDRRSEIGQQPGVSAPRRTRAGASSTRRRSAKPAGNTPRQGPSRGYMAAVGAIGLVIVLLVYALLSGGSGPSTPAANSPSANALHHRHGTGAGRSRHGAGAVTTTAALASLKLEPSAEVYVCLIGDGRKRIPGLILTPSSTEPIYHAQRFEVTLGNNAVTLVVNGKPQTVPASAQAIGYAITKTGIRTLAATEQPTCK
jgi:cytoskeleton protein RodZ